MALPPQEVLLKDEHRVVFILAIRVRGYAAWVETAEIEKARRWSRQIWLQIDNIIHHHGGHPLYHAGEGVTAVWGIPEAGNNDAESAVLAALDIRTSLEEIQADLVHEKIPALKISAGISCGSVLLGQYGDGSSVSVFGASLHLAENLAQVTSPGIIYLTAPVLPRVRGAFHLRRIAPIGLAGFHDPVPVFQVEKVQVTPGIVRYGSLASLQTRMVGREREINRLEAIYHKSQESSRPNLVLLVGDDGIGKSRLMMEFATWLETSEPSFYLLSARGQEQTTHIPFSLWKQVWRNRFGIRREDDPQTAREKFTREVQLLWGQQLSQVPAVEVAHLVGSLIGLDWPGSIYLAGYLDRPDERLTRAFELMRELLRRMIAVRPTLLILDDLHWSDPFSLKLLQYLMQSGGPPIPLMILSAVHPNFFQQPVSYRIPMEWIYQAERITLGPLVPDVQMILSAYPGLNSPDLQVLMNLAIRSFGHPLYLEELIKSMIMTDGNSGNDSFFRGMLSAQDDSLNSLRAVLQKRIESLSRVGRVVAQLGSITGRIFWVGGIVAVARVSATRGTTSNLRLSGETLDKFIQEGLYQLTHAELAFPRANSIYSNDQEYIFKHNLLRDVIYQMIPNSLRRFYHQAVADWMAGISEEDFKIMAADHYEQAGYFNRAAQQFKEAAEIAAQRGAITEQQAFLEQALVLRQMDTE